MSPTWILGLLVLLAVQPSQQQNASEPITFPNSTLLPAIRLSWAMKNVTESDCQSMINHEINMTDPTAANRAFVAGEFHQSVPITICHLYTSYHFKMAFSNLTESLQVGRNQFMVDFLTDYAESTVYLYPSRAPTGSSGGDGAATNTPTTDSAANSTTTDSATNATTVTATDATTTTVEATTTTTGG